MIGFEVILEVLVAVLLVGTIAYAAILNRKLNVLRQGREEFESLVRELNSAIERAERGTTEFRELSDASAARLDEMVTEAKVLRDDLGYLIDRGTTLADNLMESVKARRSPPSDDVVESLFADPPEGASPSADDLGFGEDESLPRETQEKLKKLINSLR